MKKGDFITFSVTFRANAKCTDPFADHPITKAKHLLEGQVKGFDLWCLEQGPDAFTTTAPKKKKRSPK